MINLFETPPAQDPQRITAIKQWVTDLLRLPATTTVVVMELRCAEPDCPPVETVIALLDTGKPTRQYKLHKAINDVTASDVVALLQNPD